MLHYFFFSVPFLSRMRVNKDFYIFLYFVELGNIFYYTSHSLFFLSISTGLDVRYVTAVSLRVSKFPSLSSSLCLLECPAVSFSF